MLHMSVQELVDQEVVDPERGDISDAFKLVLQTNFFPSLVLNPYTVAAPNSAASSSSAAVHTAESTAHLYLTLSRLMTNMGVGGASGLAQALDHATFTSLRGVCRLLDQLAGDMCSDMDLIELNANANVISGHDDRKTSFDTVVAACAVSNMPGQGPESSATAKDEEEVNSMGLKALKTWLSDKRRKEQGEYAMALSMEELNGQWGKKGRGKKFELIWIFKITILFTADLFSSSA